MKRTIILFILSSILAGTVSFSQTNLLLNGGFEDINTCTEYKSECGVEGWFYLKDVKAQMLLNENNISVLGANSFGMFYNWGGYAGFTPVIGALLPCGLQKGKRYTFKGMISAKLHNKLLLQPGICLGEKFYVPGRPFAKEMRPDSIVSMTRVPNTEFFLFEYNFIAEGPVRYLTFGTYTKEDTTGAKKRLYGTQTISLVLDNFQLVPEDPHETLCSAWQGHKEEIYEYNYRHKEMDYSLYGKGTVDIEFDLEDKHSLTQVKITPPPPKADTLKLGDVFFDFNKAILKPGALKMLEDFFVKGSSSFIIDSIYIEGHTDSVGSDKRNLELSLQRCESLHQWLLKNNITGDAPVRVTGYGRSKPVATNKTPQGRSQNRRVEMIVFRKPK
ncbi:MAG TPA: OmpA family protein [Chitinophagaceae bacterium]|jgi:outer membrane protein OmpA-like peptidoglycan-associated protein|nr:OmpA family protein [Chitinophagaceae bacterium]